VAPVPLEAAQRQLNRMYMETGRSIEKQQERQNRAGAWSSEVSYDKRREREELEAYMDTLNNYDEKLFYTGCYVVLSAPSKQDLDADTTALISNAKGAGFEFEPAHYEQIDALNTALPIGCRFCKVMQAIFTRPLSGFTPFTVHELYQPGGIFYGRNQISKNVIIGDRKTLKNGNGFTLGVTGGGKSVDVKQEMIQVFLNTKDDIIVIDPQNEYRSVAERLGGTFVDFDAESDHHINPLDAGTLKYMDNRRTFIQDKTELMCGIFSQITDYGLGAQEKSIIGRVTNKIYENVGRRNFRSPTLADFYRMLGEEPEPQALDLQLSMELS